jgi:hypothetical protein
VCRQQHTPAALYPGKDPVPIPEYCKDMKKCGIFLEELQTTPFCLSAHFTVEKQVQQQFTKFILC